MDAVATRNRVLGRFAAHKETAATLGLFAGTLFLSALLLFSAQPMFARMVLPKLGGSPSVWAVSMCFFQAVLLAGYCYAHALNRFVPIRIAPLIHLGLLAMAVIALPIGLPASRAEPPVGDAYFWLIATLSLGVGLPFFAVSANAPLLQAWFSRSGHPHANDPYFLYGASNLGSLVALLAYPVLLEPLAGTKTQATLWTVGFIVLGLSIAFCGLMMAANLAHWRQAGFNAAHTKPSTRCVAGLAWSQRFGWVWLAAIPSALLVAFTSFISTDIGSAPFLWVLPLAAFLATFILVFRERPTISHRILLTLQPCVVAGALVGQVIPGTPGWVVSITFAMLAFIVTTLIAHRELYERRPATEQLTEFYLWMSLGGVLGGVFAAIVAPQIFNTIWEYPLLLVLGLACRPGLAAGLTDRREVRDAAVIVGPGLACLALLGIATKLQLIAANNVLSIIFILGFGSLSLVAGTRPVRQLGCAAVMGLTLVMLPSLLTRGEAERSFFGVHIVATSADKDLRMLLHGTTLHGAQRLVDNGGTIAGDPEPLTYYYSGSPLARGVEAARVASGKLRGGLRAGVIGLGTGSMACHAKSGETWRFFEIDPVVVKIARDPSRFSYLERCRPNADIVLGDARLTIAKEPQTSFDYLIVDAFSSDVVPVHLMTVEAVELYLSKLSPNGILAMHVSNRYMDLPAVLSSVAGRISGINVALAKDTTAINGFDKVASDVVFITKSDAALQPIRVFPYIVDMPTPELRAWTDDFSNIIAAIWRKHK